MAMLKNPRAHPTTQTMIEPTHAASAADAVRMLPRGRTDPARPQTSTSTASDTSFAGRLARLTAADASAGTVKATARPDNEHTTRVSGHPYSRILNGVDKGMYLNQLAGNPREGAVFKLVERDDRVFHVYGSGKDKLVVEIKAKPKAAEPAPLPTGGAAPTAA